MLHLEKGVRGRLLNMTRLSERLGNLQRDLALDTLCHPKSWLILTRYATDINEIVFEVAFRLCHA
jgi:hypothetical protein